MCDELMFLGEGLGVVYTYQESPSGEGPKSICFTLKAAYFKWGWGTMFYMNIRGMTSPEDMLTTNYKVSKSKQTRAEPR